MPWSVFIECNAAIGGCVPSCPVRGQWRPALFLISEVMEYLYVPLGRPHHRNRNVKMYTLVTLWPGNFQFHYSQAFYYFGVRQ